jgi:hypothetical protein
MLGGVVEAPSTLWQNFEVHYSFRCGLGEWRRRLTSFQWANEFRVALRHAFPLTLGEDNLKINLGKTFDPRSILPLQPKARIVHTEARTNSGAVDLIMIKRLGNSERVPMQDLMGTLQLLQPVLALTCLSSFGDSTEACVHVTPTALKFI